MLWSEYEEPGAGKWKLQCFYFFITKITIFPFFICTQNQMKWNEMFYLQLHSPRGGLKNENQINECSINSTNFQVNLPAISLKIYRISTHRKQLFFVITNRTWIKNSISKLKNSMASMNLHFLVKSFLNFCDLLPKSQQLFWAKLTGLMHTFW